MPPRVRIRSKDTIPKPGGLGKDHRQRHAAFGICSVFVQCSSSFCPVFVQCATSGGRTARREPEKVSAAGASSAIGSREELIDGGQQRTLAVEG
jgi:hypothetical protein